MLHNSNFYIIISTVTALAICIMASSADGGMGMDIASVVAIVVALIGLIGTTIKDLIQSRKQSESIKDGINDVNQDTKDMKPRTQSIEKSTEKIREVVTEKLMLDINRIPAMESKVDEIYTEVEHRKRTRADVSTNVKTKDYFVEGIEQLYAKNGQLESENRELRYQLNQAQEQNQFLSDKLSELNEVNHELTKQLNGQSQENQKGAQAPILF